MTLATHRDFKSLAICKLHEFCDVLRIAGPEYGDRLVVHHMSEVISRPLQCGIIEVQLTTEILQVIPQRLRCGRVIPRRLQTQECGTAGQPFAELTAGHIPLHEFTSLG